MVDSSAVGHEELDCTKDLGPRVSSKSVNEVVFGMGGVRVDHRNGSDLVGTFMGPEFEPI